jgi:hypothetical protein
MPLESARLTWHGIELPAEVTAELARLTEDAARELAAIKQAREAAARQARADRAPAVARPSAVTNPETAGKYRQLVRVHEAFRYDAFPPGTDPDSWWYRCDVCGDKLTGAELKASPVIHVVRSYERADTGRYVEVYRRYGITTAEPTSSRPVHIAWRAGSVNPGGGMERTVTWPGGLPAFPVAQQVRASLFTRLRYTALACP